MIQHALVVFASLSHMNLVKRSFREEQRYFDAIRTPMEIAEGGCSHAILCAPDEIPEILERANTARLNVRSAYLVVNEDGESRYSPFDARSGEGQCSA